MKNVRKIMAMAMSLAMISTLAACGNKQESGSSSNNAPDDTITTTEETTTATMASEDAAVVHDIEIEGAEKLENPTLKWLSFWKLTPENGESKDVFLELFENKYGGEIEWVPTTNVDKYTKLANLVIGGDSPDMFPAADLDTFPGKVLAGQFQSMDEWIDYDDPLFPEGARRINEIHTLKGKHYMACVSANAGTIMIYNKNTIEENGLDDPAELAYNNEWTWSTFKQMCYDFADPDNDKYAIDGWWYELAMMLSTGVPVVGMEDGHIVSNLMSPEIARCQELFLEMHNAGVNFPRAEYNWKEHPEKVGEGKTLFYPVGVWQLYEPNVSVFGKPGEMMFVPMPRDEEADAWYQSAAGGLDAYAMCKGAPNPEAVAAFVKCKLVANSDESVKEIGAKQLAEDYGWTDEVSDMFQYCSDLTNANPVIDFYAAIDTDVYDALHNPIKDSSYNGTDWYSARDSISTAVQTVFDQKNKQIDEFVES